MLTVPWCGRHARRPYVQCQWQLSPPVLAEGVIRALATRERILSTCFNVDPGFVQAFPTPCTLRNSSHTAAMMTPPPTVQELPLFRNLKYPIPSSDSTLLVSCAMIMLALNISSCLRLLHCNTKYGCADIWNLWGFLSHSTCKFIISLRCIVLTLTVPLLLASSNHFICLWIRCQTFSTLPFCPCIPLDILHFHLPTTRQGSGAQYQLLSVIQHLVLGAYLTLCI